MALTKGCIHSVGELIDRDKHPVGFWLGVGFYVYGLVIFLAATNWSYFKAR